VLRLLHGDKEMREKLGRIFVRVDQDEDFRRCCLKSGRLDGSLRHYSFRE
jgi:hypothetical protein